MIASGLWYGLLRQVLSKETAQQLYTEAPMKYLAPAILLAISVAIVVVFWNSRRYASYGAIAVVAFAVIISLALSQRGGVRS